MLFLIEICFRHCPGKEDEEIVKRRPLSSAGVYTALEQQKGDRRYFATRYKDDIEYIYDDIHLRRHLIFINYYVKERGTRVNFITEIYICNKFSRKIIILV